MEIVSFTGKKLGVWGYVKSKDIDLGEDTLKCLIMGTAYYFLKNLRTPPRGSHKKKLLGMRGSNPTHGATGGKFFQI